MDLKPSIRAFKRKDSHRSIAFFWERSGQKWTSLRDVLPGVAAACGVRIDGKRRSDVAIECAEALPRMGFVPPNGYVAPWHRSR